MNRRLLQAALRVLLSLSLYYQLPSPDDIAELRESSSTNDARPLDELARDVIIGEIQRR